MAEQQTPPTWAFVGAKVAYSHGGMSMGYNETTIEKITPTQIVTEVKRFHIKSLRETGGSYSRLVPRDDPDYVSWVVERELRTLGYQLEQELCIAGRKGDAVAGIDAARRMIESTEARLRELGVR